MRGHRQGAIVHGVHDLGTEVPLYDFSGMHDMAGIGVDLGAEVPLYDFSGMHDMGAIGVDLGNPLSMATEYVQNLTAGLTTTQKVIGVLGVLAGLGLATGAVKAKSLNPLAMLGIGKKKRTNRRRRRRRNGAHLSGAHASRTNRRRRRRARRNPVRTNRRRRRSRR